MRLADRYVFGELILPFFIGTLAVLMMLVGNTLYAILPGLLQMHWPVSLVLRVCVLNIPTVLVLTLPVSTALATSLATNRMARDNEFTVMRSAGTPLMRAFLPMFLFGAIMSVIDLYVYDQVVPWAYQQQQSMTQYLYNNLGSNPVDVATTFKEGDKTISFQSAQKISETRRRLNNVVIVTNPPAGSGQYPEITTARTVDYENGIWTLQDLVDHHYTSDGMTQMDTVAATGTMRMTIDLAMLQQQQPQFGQDQSIYSFKDLTQKAESARRLGNRAVALSFEVERWFKIALPLMCLVLAICSPPLGLRFARTGTFTGVLLSIISVFVAWNTLLLLKMVALGGYVPPIAAAAVTDLLFIGFGLWLFRVQE